MTYFKFYVVIVFVTNLPSNNLIYDYNLLFFQSLDFSFEKIPLNFLIFVIKISLVFFSLFLSSSLVTLIIVLCVCFTYFDVFLPITLFTVLTIWRLIRLFLILLSSVCKNSYNLYFVTYDDVWYVSNFLIILLRPSFEILVFINVESTVPGWSTFPFHRSREDNDSDLRILIN